MPAIKESDMKKYAAFAAILCLMCVFAFAEAPEAAALPHANQGELIVNAGALFGYYGFGIGGGAEYIFARWDIAKSVPLTFGAGPLAASGTSYFINPNLAIHADISIPYFIGLGVGYTGMIGVKWKL
jgi:hypothetical protein